MICNKKTEVQVVLSIMLGWENGDQPQQLANRKQGFTHKQEATLQKGARGTTKLSDEQQNF